ncbi:MAG TPA: penicillin-binding transpeptidase domain-containing protein, partial [Pyrinomonadaceae bacterium]|nr:penicillin-binding transpeptidase domain-containing protein [Pyrinomonadaceae bacterium]
DGNANIDLTDSLAYSNNGYFQSVGGRVGFEHMMQTARELGLGERTGINYANEYPGRLPVFKTGYAVNHMCSHGDDIEVTPIQLASLVSAIANGGELLVPHLPRTPQEDIQFRKQTRRKVKVSEDILRRMVPGMIGAVNYGTARLAYDARQTIAGKTGTCIGQGSWLGLFTSFAPVSNPQLAVVVITRGSSERGRVAAGIAGKIYRALSGRFGTPVNMPVANTPVPHPRISGRAAAAVSDEEQGDEEDVNGDAATTTATGTTTGAQAPNATQRNQGGTVQRVLMPVQSRPAPAPANPQRSTVIPAPTPQQESRPRRVQPTQP